MKKILITALAAGVLASSLGNAYAEVAKGEVKAGVIEAASTKTVAHAKKKLVIGLIEGYDKEKELVKIKPIFDLAGGVKGDGTVYISVKGAEFRDGKVTEYPDGYLISVYYDEVKKSGEDLIVDADFVSAVEENGEVTINDGIASEVLAGSEKEGRNEVGINPPKEIKKKNLLIGMIEEYDAVNKKAKVKPLFGHEKSFSDGKAIIVNLMSAEYEGKLEDNIEGKLISVYYKDVFEREDSVIVEGELISSIEENREVGINPPKERKEKKTVEKELVIGVIEGYDSDSKKVKIKPIFGLTGKLDGKTAYIDLTDAEFPKEGVKEFPKGYLISVYYDTVLETDKEIIVEADVLSAVEEDGEVSIAKGEEVKEENQMVQIQMEEEQKNEDKGFFQAIADFFVNIFKF